MTLFARICGQHAWGVVKFYASGPDLANEEGMLENRTITLLRSHMGCYPLTAHSTAASAWIAVVSKSGME